MLTLLFLRHSGAKNMSLAKFVLTVHTNKAAAVVEYLKKRPTRSFYVAGEAKPIVLHLIPTSAPLLFLLRVLPEHKRYVRGFMSTWMDVVRLAIGAYFHYDFGEMFAAAGTGSAGKISNSRCAFLIRRVQHHARATQPGARR